MKTITVGEQAPLFTLLDENEKEVSLASYIGKKQVLVYFYPNNEFMLLVIQVIF